jgi:hypothetical protein
MSIKRVKALAASFVCSVENTRCPVSAAWIAISAVSRSRISPTRMMFGAARSIAFRMRAKVSPIFGLTWTWLSPRMWYSTGSSAVMILTSGRLSSESAAYSVVVFPEPVGPVTSTMPFGRLIARRNHL